MWGLMVLLVDCRNGKREDRTCAELFSPGGWMFWEDGPDYKDWCEDRARL